MEGATLGEALTAAGQRLPAFAAACLTGERLQAGCLASVNGEHFTSEPRSTLKPDDVVLVLSADVGG